MFDKETEYDILTCTAHWDMLFHVLQNFSQFYFYLMEQTLCDRQYS